MKNSVSFADRLRKVRDLLEVSQQKLASQLGISKTAWQGYELGKNEPGSGVIKELVNLGFNANWILTGEGLIRKAEHHNFTTPLLTIIIEDLEEYEKERSGEKLKPQERLDIIRTSCDMLIDSDVVSDQVKDKIIEYINNVHDFLPSIDMMIKKEEGRERARNILKNKFKKIWPHDDLEREVEEFLQSRIIKYNQEKGRN